MSSYSLTSSSVLNELFRKFDSGVCAATAGLGSRPGAYAHTPAVATAPRARMNTRRFQYNFSSVISDARGSHGRSLLTSMVILPLFSKHSTQPAHSRLWNGP